MADEYQFHESDVIFLAGDDDGDASDGFFNFREIVVAPPRRQHRNSKKKMASCSFPVGIPQSIARRTVSEEEPEEEGVPPHVILERRLAGKMAFSVCSGSGRTLKGRDLRRVRNSILRMTGFLET